MAGHANPERRFDEEAVQSAQSAADLVGYLNYIHPYRVQIVGRREVAYLSDVKPEDQERMVAETAKAFGKVDVLYANAGIGEAGTGAGGFRGAFIRVQEMHAHPERMILAQHSAEFRSDSLGEYGWHFSADSYEFDMRNGSQASEDPVQFLIAECQRVTAGDEDIAYLYGIFEVVEDGFQSLLIGLDFSVSNNS